MRARLGALQTELQAWYLLLPATKQDFELKKNEIEKLNNEIFPQLDLHLQKIEERLNGIGSHFNKFNFNKILLLFPLVIVSGFILCINFLLDSIKFSQLFIRYYSKRDTNHRILSNEEIVTASELWIDYEIKSQILFLRKK